MFFLKLAVGIGLIGFGAFVLLNRDRMLRASQKHLRQNVGEVGEAFADKGKPNHMIVPGIGCIAIGIVLIVQAAI